MTAKHTPGPWRIDEYRNFVTPDGPLYLGGVNTPLALGEDMRKGWENARRIVACVNACEGISTQNLEDNVPFLELARQYNVVLRERDALRAELEAAKKNNSAWLYANAPGGWIDNLRVKCEALRARIAQVDRQEPVAWMCSDKALIQMGYKKFSDRCEGEWNIPVFAGIPGAQGA